MDDPKTITVTLPGDLIESIDAAVQGGDFRSRDEAVRVALEQAEADRIIERIGIERVREMWREGVESGHTKDAKAVFDRLIEKYERLAAERASEPPAHLLGSGRGRS